MTLSHVWFEAKNVKGKEVVFGSLKSIKEEHLYYNVRCVDYTVEPKGFRKGFYTIDADSIWIDKRDETKKIIRVKGDIKITKELYTNTELEYL
jgi:tRNA(His) 5'-end guanylyltransferase